MKSFTVSLALAMSLLVSSLTAFPAASPVSSPPAGEERRIDGVVQADDYPDLHVAVAALGERGGAVVLGARTYTLEKPIKLTRRVVFQGIMDAKARDASTKIVPSANFSGEWLFETETKPAESNPDLNADFGFYDLVVVATPQIGGIHAANGDVLRIERCRFAYMRTCVEVTQDTALPRPFPARIVPGGLFINNSIFQASEVCLNLEYATQNRIIGNWFVSNSGVVLRLLNSNKTWFVANEVNQFTRAAVLLEDDGGGGNHVHNNVIALNWMHSNRPDTRFIETVNGDRMHNILVTDNILQGTAGLRLPPMGKDRGNRFEGNTGGPAAITENAGAASVPAGRKSLVVRHGLIQAPLHVSITPEGETSGFWVDHRTAESFEVHFKDAPARPLDFSWSARVFP